MVVSTRPVANTCWLERVETPDGILYVIHQPEGGCTPRQLTDLQADINQELGVGHLDEWYGR